MKKTLLTVLVAFLIAHNSFGQSCAGAQTLTATPPPSPLGTYAVGTVVTFCYTVSNYSQNGADWIAGIVPTLGPAWDASTLTPVTLPVSCDLQGNWAWYLTATGTASGQTYGPGFYYDTPAGGPGLDGIPGNNYGDNCQNNTWSCCFSIEVGQCLPTGSSSLFVGVTPLSDYSVGSWGNNDCIDPVFSYGVLNCVDACALTVPTVTIVDATCNNSNDGSITAFPSGASPYTYLWSNGSTTQTNSNLAPGIYTLTVTDSIGCEKVVTFPVGGPSAIVLNETVVDNGCNTTGGSITLAPSGGTGTTYTYLWSDGSSGSSLTNLQGGTYTVTVTDANNCTQVGSFTISTVVPLAVTPTTVNGSCTGNDGSASVSVTGGTAPYTYLWSDGTTGSSISNLAPGSYTVTITDAGQCDSTVVFNITGTTPIVLNETIVDNSCTAADGSITLAPTGGTGSGYTYQWSNGATTSTITNLAGGTYTVTVTDAFPCTSTQTFTITTVIPLVTSASATNTSCGGTDGTVTATVSGGVQPYTYSWQPIGGTGPVASNLPSGTYTCTITDAAGCTSTTSASVQAIGQFTLSTTFVPLGCDPLGTTTATVTTNGGTAPFTYLWIPIGGNGATGTGLTSGTYVVLVTDANGCIDSSTIVIPGVVPISLSSGTTPVQCNQPNSGTATTTASGGNAPYTYLWSNGSTSATATNLDAGVYTVTVTDASGCTQTNTVIVTVIPNVFASAGTDQTVCNGTPATITASATGGTAPFTYTWNNGPVSDSQTVTPTVTTTYTVTVSDANSCTSTSTVTVNVIDYPVVTVSSDANICYNSSTLLQAGGGSSGATYSWSPATGLDDSGSQTPVANPTQTTTYTVTVSNAQCSATGTVTVNVAPQIFGAFTADSTSGQAPLTVNFANTTSGAVSYLWDFGDGNSSTDEDPTHTYISMGTYDVILVSTNSLGCTDTVRFLSIIVDSESSLVIPNIFTPNGDNFNDLFDFEEIGIASIDVMILNRWGLEVYTWNLPNGSWDGKSSDGTEVPEGVYIYVVNATGINSKAYSYKGTVQLIRNKN